MTVIISVIMLVACNDVTSLFKGEASQSTKLKEDSFTYTNEPEEAAREYYEALQSENYKQAYNMLSSVFIDAGLTYEQFKKDIEISNFDFKGHEPFITKSSRSPREISEQSKDENIYRLNVTLSARGETRDDYERYEAVTSNWFDSEMWFREEDGEWKYFGLGFLKDIVWRTDVYAAGLKMMEALRNSDGQQLYDMYANYYIDQGYTPAEILNQHSELVYYRITEINRVGEGDEAFEIVGRKLQYPNGRRVEVNHIPQDYLVIFDYTFHQQDGEWKYATTQFKSRDIPLDVIKNHYNGIEITSNNRPVTEETENDDYTDLSDNDYADSIETEEIAEEEHNVIDSEQEKQDKNQPSEIDGNNPFGTTNLDQATIDQLDNPLYQNQILPSELIYKIESGYDVTVYFYSPTCVFCNQTIPYLVPLAEFNGMDLKLLNLLEFYNEYKTFGITATPSLVHFKNGQEYARIEGMQSEEDFQLFFDQYVLD